MRRKSIWFFYFYPDKSLSQAGKKDSLLLFKPEEGFEKI